MTPEAEEGWRVRARDGLLDFIRWMFRARKGAKWELGAHHYKLATALTKVYSGETKRLIINIPPRYSKTEFVVNFMAWAIGQYPDCEFIYSSYSGRLAAKSSWDCRSIIQHPEYAALFPAVKLRDDSAAKDEWRTTAGGMVYAVGAGGTITGYGAGKMRAGFGGCFPYDQEVETNIGPVKIGDIVTKQVPVLVWSVNKKTGTKELAPVDTLWTNPANSILEITLDDGSSFQCTPNHKILTRSGWVEARHLAKSLDLPERQPGLFHCLRSGFALVCSRLNGVAGRLWPRLKPRSNAASGSAMPCFPDLNLSNSCGEDSKLSGNNGALPQIIVDLDGIASGDLCSRPTFHKRESAVADGVLHVFGLCSPCKILKAVVCGVSVKMASLIHWRTDADKGFKNKRVDVSEPNLTGNTEAYPKISLPVRGWLNRPGRGCSPDKAKVADFIKPIGSVDRLPVSVRLVGHEDVTFCLEVRGNNNFILSQSGAIVSNCIIVDDPHKADEATSDVMRENVWEWFQGTIESRTNSPDTPIIVIMQRLHESDLSGRLLRGANGEEWECLSLPAIREDGSALWPYKHSIERLRDMEQAAPYHFAGQYLQRPAPLDGGVIKPDRMPVLEAIPAGTRFVRGWDLAATEKKGGNDPDWTVGAKLGQMPDGRWIIADIARFQGGPEDVEAAVKSAAVRDGTSCTISIPQDPGQAGKAQAKRFSAMLGGWTVNVSPESGDKVTRAQPFAAQVNVGNVCMLKAPWNDALVSEMRLFPNAMHDDQIDACSRSFVEITQGGGGLLDHYRQMAEAAKARDS